MDRGFIESVAEPAHYPIYLYGPVRQKYHIEDHIALDSHTTAFRSILRTRFVQNVNHGCRRVARQRFLFRSFGRRARIRKARGLHRSTLAAAGWRIRYAVSKSRARPG